MLTVLRREEKYLISAQEAFFYEEQFSKVLHHDPYSVNSAYNVRSLYFDTVDDRDFFDKVNEQNLRRKIRLRIYGPDDNKAKLEIKQKENIYQKKRSLIISREEALRILDGDYSVLLNYKEEFAGEVYCLFMKDCYRPKTIIEYQRRAFMAKENNIRLTFDSKIRALEGSRDLFGEHLPLYPVAEPDEVVFEVKYNQFMLGYISDIISCIEKRGSSFSKYCRGRNVGYYQNL